LDLEVFSFVVYVCVVVDGYTEGECVYDGENAACVFSVYMGLLATVIAFALLAGRRTTKPKLVLGLRQLCRFLEVSIQEYDKILWMLSILGFSCVFFLYYSQLA
jgi:hypothetical protein